MSLADTSDVPRTAREHGLRSWIWLAGWIALSNVAGALGAIASLNAREFYSALDTPSWAPPGWVFGPAWTTLYILMGIAAWLVWREHPAGAREILARRRGLKLFIVQLGVNALWTWLFFAWARGALALVEILVLAILIVLTMLQFARVRTLASWLLVPYLAWVSFATALTWSLWRANPALL